jgi:predicted HTH transcriptional regulator
MPTQPSEFLDENLRDLVLNPREGLPVELKRWLDLSNRSHQAKIIRGCAAIYNSNGGYVLIGFNDDGTAHRDGIPVDFAIDYEPEKIQQIVANNTSPPIEVSVRHVRVNDIVCVVIKVPALLRQPASRATLGMEIRPYLRPTTSTVEH